ncbi:MAG TPA: TPM domain-containing protein [Flavobacteriaceae bacterium]|nr:TPM domain-containing protein [Flavobacteriaceae bacterium]
MANIEDFLNQEEQQEIIKAIQKAERNTSGEIRVHIEKSSGKDALNQATKVFDFLKMDNTRERNGVLIYVAIDTRDLVILGDIGINDVVPSDFWESTKDAIISEFKNGDYKKGLIDGILTAGEQLKSHFPFKKGRGNELPDDISFG